MKTIQQTAVLLVLHYSRYITVHSSVLFSTRILFSCTNATKQIQRTDSCTPRRFQPLRDLMVYSPPLFPFSPANIYIHSTEAVLYEILRQLLCYSTVLYDQRQTFYSQRHHRPQPGGEREDFRKDNALIKIQRQIDKPTVQALVGNCPHFIFLFGIPSHVQYIVTLFCT